MWWAADDRGLTLVEVLVAAVILGIVAVGFFTASDVNRRMVESGISEMKAFYLAQEKMEELRAVSYESVVTVSNLSDFDPPVDGFQYKTAVVESLAPQVKTVAVSVYYTVGSVQRSVTLVTERSG
jgi:prepilin-type N-terminal cleavage/methylation domain-containing protein